MTPSFASVNPLLITIVLATLAIGLPIVMVMSIRFLADRRVNLGRSKEVEKLIWQLHRIASALEHQLNLSFPAVQPGTEEAQDLMYLHQMSARPNAATGAGAGATTIAAAAASQPEAQQAVASAINSSPATLPPLQTSSPDAPRRGVNSMFDL
jgi:hypothetical protein